MGLDTPAASSPPAIQTVANSTARLALTGLTRGARVYQTDTGFWYELTNAAAPSDAASWQNLGLNESCLASVQVSTNVGTKQALYTVPAAQKCVITHIVLRSASANLAAMVGEASTEFGFTGSDFWSDGDNTEIGGTLVNATAVLNVAGTPTSSGAQYKSTIGSAAEVFGVTFAYTAIAATVQIDVFGYRYPA